MTLKINVSIPNSALRGGAVGAGTGAAVYMVLAGVGYAIGELASFGMSGETFRSTLKKGLKTTLPVLMVLGAAAGGFITA